MPVFLFLLGIILAGVGLFLVGFSIPFRDFSLGNTLIVSGATAIVGGVIVIGLAATLRELRKIARQLEAGAGAPRPVTAAATTAAATPAARPAPAPPVPPRQPAKAPPVVNTTRSQRAEPRLDAPADTAAPEAPMPQAPTIADITAERPRGLFASIRGRSQATPQPAPRPAPGVGPTAGPSAPATAAPAPTAGMPPVPGGPLPDLDDDHPLPPPRRGAHPDRPPFHPEHEGETDGPRSPSLAALAARTAARLDLPRPVPELPRAAQEPAPDDQPSFEMPSFERPAPEPPPEKPLRNMFDTVWPSDGKSSSERAAEPPPPPEPKPPEILKSGVIDGMAYTLYTDGSIEAQLPQGTLRFTSIDDLRGHLERGG
jgi:hypothetical protein